MTHLCAVVMCVYVHDTFVYSSDMYVHDTFVYSSDMYVHDTFVYSSDVCVCKLCICVQ